MTSTAIHELTDTDFVTLLRQRTEAYLKTVDAWESTYGNYYRLKSPGQVSSDLSACQENFLRARADLAELLPRARRLCLKHDLKYPWELIIRVELGANPPQTRTASAIGRGERNLVHQCMAALEAATHVTPEAPETDLREPHDERPRRHGILARFYDFFF